VGGGYSRVVKDSGLLECDTASLVKCYLTNSCILHRQLSFWRWWYISSNRNNLPSDTASNPEEQNHFLSTVQ